MHKRFFAAKYSVWEKGLGELRKGFISKDK